MFKSLLRSLFLTLTLAVPAFSYAATPSMASNIVNRVQERLEQRMVTHSSTPTTHLASSEATVEAESLNMSSMNNLRNSILNRFKSSSNTSSVIASSSKSSVSSSRSSSSRSSSSARTSSAASSISQAPSGNVVAQVLTLLNQERAKEGLPSLKNNSLLEKAAAGHAQDMNANTYFDHYGLSGSSPTQRIKSAGYPNVPACNCNRQFYYGENIARGQTTAVQVMNDWMNSPGHRANIMSANFREVGIAISGTYWVQDFGGVWDR